MSSLHLGFVSRELPDVKTVKKTCQWVLFPPSHIQKRPILLLQ